MSNRTVSTINKNKRKNKKRKSKGSSSLNKLKKIIIILVILFCVFILIKSTKSFEELFGEKDIEKNKIEYFIDTADEISDGKAQVNWKYILAIESVLNKGDLSKVKKIDSIKIGNKFLKGYEDKQKKEKYRVNNLDKVLDDLKFNEFQKVDVNRTLDKLKNLYSNEKISDNDGRIKFIKSLEGPAIKNYYNYNILPSITIAQAILESGWGNSSLTKNSYNLFGIKADSRWKGKSVKLKTSENYNDKIYANFRSYNSLEESVDDYGKFLSQNMRYKEHGFFDVNFYKSQAKALENAGYSTKKNEKGEKMYANMLSDVIKRYNLQLIDNKILTN